MEIKNLKIIDSTELNTILKDLSDLDNHFESLDKDDIYRALVNVSNKLINL